MNQHVLSSSMKQFLHYNDFATRLKRVLHCVQVTANAQVGWKQLEEAVYGMCLGKSGVADQLSTLAQDELKLDSLSPPWPVCRTH